MSIDIFGASLLRWAFPYFLRQVTGIPGFRANNIANGILRAILFRPYQGVFFSYNYRTVLRYARKCNFIRPRKKILETHKHSTALHVYLLHRFQLNRTNVENMDRNSFTPHSSVFTALVFANLAITQNISVDLPCTECHPNRTNYNTAKFNLRP